MSDQSPKIRWLPLAAAGLLALLYLALLILALADPSRGGPVFPNRADAEPGHAHTAMAVLVPAAPGQGQGQGRGAARRPARIDSRPEQAPDLLLPPIHASNPSAARSDMA